MPEEKIRRYGFHGTSHKYISQRACDFTGINISNSKMEWMGIKFSQSLNEQNNGKEGEISSSDSKVKVMVVPTNEELMIVSESAALAESKL